MSEHIDREPNPPPRPTFPRDPGYVIHMTPGPIRWLLNWRTRRKLRDARSTQMNRAILAGRLALRLPVESAARDVYIALRKDALASLAQIEREMDAL